VCTTVGLRCRLLSQLLCSRAFLFDFNRNIHLFVWTVNFLSAASNSAFIVLFFTHLIGSSFFLLVFFILLRVFFKYFYSMNDIVRYIILF